MSYTLPLARLIEEFRRLPGVGPKSAQRLAFHVLKQPVDDVRRFARTLVDARDLVGYCQRCYNLSAQPICDICRQPGRKKELLCVVAEPRDLYALERTNEYKGLYHVLQGLISPLEGVGPQDLKIRELVNRLGPSSSQDMIQNASVASSPVSQPGESIAIEPTIELSAASLMADSSFQSKLEVYLSSCGNFENAVPQTLQETTLASVPTTLATEAEVFPPIQEVILALPPSIEGDTTSLYLARLLKPVTTMRLTRIAFGLPVGADLEYADSMTITRALQGRQLV